MNNFYFPTRLGASFFHEIKWRILESQIWRKFGWTFRPYEQLIFREIWSKMLNQIRSNFYLLWRCSIWVTTICPNWPTMCSKIWQACKLSFWPKIISTISDENGSTDWQTWFVLICHTIRLVRLIFKLT